LRRPRLGTSAPTLLGGSLCAGVLQLADLVAAATRPDRSSRLIQRSSTPSPRLTASRRAGSSGVGHVLSSTGSSAATEIVTVQYLRPSESRNIPNRQRFGSRRTSAWSSERRRAHRSRRARASPLPVSWTPRRQLVNSRKSSQKSRSAVSTRPVTLTTPRSSRNSSSDGSVGVPLWSTRISNEKIPASRNSLSPSGP